MELGQSLPDIPRIYTALAEWIACMLCIYELKRKYCGWKMGVLAAGALVFQGWFLAVTDNVDGIWWMVCMAAAVFFMFAFLYVSCEIDRMTAVYFCVRAFVTAEFAASLEWQIACMFRTVGGWRGIVLQGVCLLLIYGAVFAFARVIYRNLLENSGEFVATLRETISFSVIGISVFLVSNLGFAPIPITGKFQMIADIIHVRTMVDLGGMAILYAYHVQRVELRVGYELEKMEAMLQNQYEQYQFSREMMDTINYKYHDLKHHLIALRAAKSEEERERLLESMEEELQGYAGRVQTGSGVLDTLLTMKNMYCVKNNITMTCMVDGESVAFLDPRDVCSVFGNALDNAIECVEKISQTDRRIIHVKACRKKNFLQIRFENYCEQEMKLRDGLPVTTKKSTGFHGYGLKSIRNSIGKYDGAVDVELKDNWFILRILIPMKPEWKADPKDTGIMTDSGTV